jgi:hypothetical protein
MSTGGPKKTAGHQMNLMRRNLSDPRRTIHFFKRFINNALDDTTSHAVDWAIQEDAGAVYTLGDARGGVWNLTTDSTDNDELYVASRSQAFIFNTTDKVMFECEFSNTAVTGTQRGAYVGLLDLGAAANNLVDNTMLIAASFDGAVFNLEAAADLAFVTSNAATQVRTAAAKTWTDGDTVRAGFIYDPNDGTTAKVTPVIDGVDGTAHDLTISGLQEMNVGFGVKNGEAGGGAQVLGVKWVQVIQELNAAADIGGL